MVKTKRSPVQHLPAPFRWQMMRRAATKSPIKMLTPEQRLVNGVRIHNQKMLDQLRWRMKFEDECELLEDDMTMQE